MKKVLLLILLSCLALSAAALAQGPPPPPRGGPGGPPPPEIGVLKDALSLTDSQLTSLKILMDTRMQTVQGIMPQLDAAQKALDDALNAANPDPAQLGALLITVNGFRTQIKQADQTFAAGCKALLTADQLVKLNNYLSMMDSLPVLMALQSLHL
jgi:Spy/CpxP family protein refolding chaperone